MAIGVDIEEINRFKNKSEKFLNRIYTSIEKDYCLQKARPESHLAVRFCAKEAVIKALNALDIKIVSYNKIEIFHAANGCPKVRVLENLAPNIDFEISLSHDNTKAIAFVTAKRI